MSEEEDEAPNFSVRLWLTSAQMDKYQNKQPFQCTFQQLNNNKKAAHFVQLTLEKKEFTKLQRNRRNEKGFRFKPDKIIGGMIHSGDGFFSSALGAAKSLAGNQMVQQLGKQALQKGLSMAANSNNSLISGAANMAKPLVGGRLKKGSPEAREHMARLRAMRKGEGFGSFLKTVGKVAKNPLVQQIGKQALNVGLTAASMNPMLAPAAGMASSMINRPAAQQQVGNGLRHQRYVNDFSPFVGGTPVPIHYKRGGSFMPL
jgi:hypothetical protein